MRHMKSILPLACTAALVLFATRAPLRAQSSVQRRYIYSISINPVALTASQPQSVVVGARVSADSALITDGVVLNEYDINGKALRSLGRMYDDGTHGDAVANDSVFTTTVTLTESAPVLLEVSASYRGSLRRVMS